MDSRIKENQRFLMKRVDALTEELHHVMRILDLISQLVEQDEAEEGQFDINSSDDDSIGQTKSVIQLLDECSDEECD
jgi:hypothetical protein